MDYETQGSNYIITFPKGGSRYSDYLPINRTNDNLVEDDEYYSLKIVTEILHEDITAINPSTAKVILVNQDGKYYNSSCVAKCKFLCGFTVCDKFINFFKVNG